MLSEEKVGLERVVEALQCNMWSNMIRKPMPKFTVQEEEEKKELDVPEETKIADTKPRPDSAEAENKKSNDSNKSNPVHLDELNPNLSIPDYSKTAHGTEPNDFEKDERNLEELGSLMVQMKSLKENIKGMDMEQRHNNAVNMIKKIAGFMDLGDEDDLFDSEEDVDYDQIIAQKVDEEHKKNQQTSQADTN